MASRYSFDDFAELITKAQLIGTELLIDQAAVVNHELGQWDRNVHSATLPRYTVKAMRDLLKFDADLKNLDRIKFQNR